VPRRRPGTQPITISQLSLIPEAKTVVGGIVGSATQTRQMIDFAARHNIRQTSTRHSTASARAAPATRTVVEF
jgi:uncharacterized zinc-type alcohol dehydrogenase-like protein